VRVNDESNCAPSSDAPQSTNEFWLGKVNHVVSITRLLDIVEPVMFAEVVPHAYVGLVPDIADLKLTVVGQIEQCAGLEWVFEYETTSNFTSEGYPPRTIRSRYKNLTSFVNEERAAAIAP
jgi:hypothetical protein